ncbi:MAG: D-glycero-alpha-D-manno-heptose-1,7-bisphosphate 7-phosphatase [Planctomycetota bacterium]|jgi:D,D-heptose 1,7-bisphosphate phosphatase
MSNKAIFLDRDDTLIEDPGYVNNPDQVELLGGVPEALIEFRAMGYKLIVISNQSGVARGIITEKALDAIHDRLKQLLTEKGAHLDGIYYCPYHPEGVVRKYTKESENRKPNPGMLLKAADEMDIDLSLSWAIGDSGRDVEAGLRAGCKTILIDSPSHTKKYEPGRPKPDYKAVNIKEVVNIIKKYHRSSGERSTGVQQVLTQETQPMTQPDETSEEPQLQTISADQGTSGGMNEQLLSNILEQLKSMQRADMFEEFAMMRVIAGIVQGFVFLCLLISVWLLMNLGGRDNSVLTALGFAVVFQLMALTFYIMQGRK